MRAVIVLAGSLFVCGTASGQGASVQRECISSRETAPRARAGRARFIMDHAEPRFAVRSATLTRSLTCSFRRGRLLHADEAFYLRLVSQDRDDPGFTTGAPGVSRRYYLVCEGRVGTTLAGFAAAQQLSFADNAFTLPCGHMIYREGMTDPAGAERVSGRYAYRVESATWTVRRGPTPARPTFDVAIDVVVRNPVETLHLRGRVVGELSTSVRVFECPEPRNSKQELPPGCR